MQAKIGDFKLVSQSEDPNTPRPFEVELTLKGFVTRREMEIIQTAKIQGLHISSIGCAKLQRASKNEGRDKI